MEKACGCIIIENDKVLLIKQHQGFWGFPKGHVEINETEKETAIREVKEETNLDVEIISDKRYTTNYIVKDNVEKEVVFFLAKKTGGYIKPQEEEVSSIKWCSIDEALETITFDNLREILKKVLKDCN